MNKLPLRKLIAAPYSTIAGDPPYWVFDKDAESNVGLFFSRADAEAFALFPEMLMALETAHAAMAVMVQGRASDLSDDAVARLWNCAVASVEAVIEKARDVR